MIAVLSAGRDASKELRSRLAFTEAAQRALLATPRPGLGELAILSTCHRTELYATGDGPDPELVHGMAALLPRLHPTDQHELHFLQGAEAIEHLFRVACGLDSLVVGESQVLGQVRRAMLLAEETGAIGPLLSNIFQRAIRLGKLARSETPLGRIGASIGAIAADFLSDHLRGLEARHGLIVGAGEAASDAGDALRKAGADLTIVSRTLESAASLAGELGGDAVPRERLREALSRVNFAVVAVSGGVFVTESDLPDAFASVPFPMLDLSTPSAVDYGGRPDIELRSLEDIPGPRGPEITDAIIDAEAMVKREVMDLLQWADTRASGPVIRELHRLADRIVAEEVGRVAGSMDLGREDEERVRVLADRIASKLLHGPMSELRRADEQTRALIRKMFRLGD